MTEYPFNTSLIGILDVEGTVIGTGFLVADHLALTCAHVVRQAGGNPGGEVNIRFAGGAAQQTAQVDANAWSPAQEHDIALLHISNVPEAAKSFLLGNAAGGTGHPFRSFGYAKVGSLQGIGARGQIVEVVDQGQSLQITSQEIDRGFSGSPVIDDERGVVVGMITWGKVMTSTERNRDTTFAVTVETIRAICPELQLTEICPYRGLDAFTEDTARFFHGRSRVVRQLIGMLKKQPRFLAVLGPSGCGKSSLVQAGLIPQLRDGALSGSERWQFFTIRPGNDPLVGLETAGLPGATGDLCAAMGQWSVAHSQTHPVLLLDQFEELFTITPEVARGRFLEQLAGLLTSDLPVTVILTLRDDFYSLFTRQLPALTPWLERGLINVPLNLEHSELYEIVAAPAELVGLQFEPGLVDTIIADVFAGGGESASTLLPLLEFALAQLWERRQDGQLTHTAYQKLGGVAGGLTFWANRAYRDIPRESRELARHVLMYLVRLGDETQNLPDTRRRMALVDLVPIGIADAAVRKVVKSLADAHLLVTHGDEVEIIHEVLLHNWPQLRGWLDEDRAGLRVHHHLTEAAAEWRRLEYDIGQLYRGAQLAEAVEWAATHPFVMNGPESDFLEASRQHAKSESAEREAQRQRELEQAKRLAQTQRQRAAILAVGLLIAVVLTVMAFSLYQQVNKNIKIALNNAATATSALGLSELHGTQAAQQASIAQAASTQAIEQQRLAQYQALLARARYLETQGQTVYEKQPLLGLRLVLEGLALLPIEDIANRMSLTATARQLAAGGRLISWENVDEIFPVPNEDLLIVSYNNAPGALYRISDGALVMQLSDKMKDATFSPDTAASYFVVRYREQPPELRRTSDGLLVTQFSDEVGWIYFSADAAAEYFVVVYEDKPAELRHTFDGTLVALLSGKVANWGVTFSSDGAARCFVVVYEDKPAELRHTSDGALVRQLGDGGIWPIFSSDAAASYFVMKYTKQPGELRRTSDGSLITQLSGDVGWVYFTADVAASSFIVCYIEQPGELRRTFDGLLVSQLSSDVHMAYFSPGAVTEHSIVVVDYERRPDYEPQFDEIRRVSDGSIVAKLPDNIHLAYFSPDAPASYIVIEYKTQLGELRRTSDGALVARLPGELSTLGIVFNSDATGGYFVADHGGQAGELRRIGDATLVTQLTGEVGWIVFSSDVSISYFIVGYLSGSSELRRTSDGSLIAQLPDKANSLGITFSPDAAAGYIVIDYENRPGELRHTSDGSLVTQLSGPVRDVTFSPDSAASYFVVEYEDRPGELRHTSDGSLAVQFSGTISWVTFDLDKMTNYFIVRYESTVEELWRLSIRPYRQLKLDSGLDSLVFWTFAKID